MKKSNGWTIFWLILFFPVGLYRMWRYEQFPKVARIIITAVVGILVISNIVNGGNNKPATPASTTAQEEVKKDTPKEEVKKGKTETYTELISAKRNFAQSCFDYKNGSRTDYLTFDFKEDKDSSGYHWGPDTVTVTTKEGTELEFEVTSDKDVSFKFIDSEEYIVKIKYHRIKGEEKYQTFTVKKPDIVVGPQFDPSQCEEKPSTTDVSDIDVPDIDVPETDTDVDGPEVCGPGETWVKGHYRSGNWVEGHCRKK